MNIIIIDESNHKQLIKSRRLLAKYFQQVSSRTYIGHISQEGLDNLHAELKSITNRYTSIACFKVVTKVRIELQWILGNKNNFDTDGTYCFRQENIRSIKAIKKTEENNTIMNVISDKTEIEHVMENILSVAALFHDIGKSNILFQQKLQKGSGCEPLRHELMSFLVIEKYFKDIVANNHLKNDYEFFEYLSKQDLKNSFSTFLNHDKFNIEISSVKIEQFFLVRSENKKFGELSSKLAQTFIKGDTFELIKFPILVIILWLVLTHHRIIDEQTPEKRNTQAGNIFMSQTYDTPVLHRLNGLSERKYINLSNFTKQVSWKDNEINENITFIDWTKEDIQKNLSVDLKLNSYLPWFDNDWLDKMSHSFLNLAQALKNELDLDINDWCHLALLYLRPALITSDFLGSINKKEITSFKDESVFANSFFEKGQEENSGIKKGDSLRQHLKTVANNTHTLHHILLNQEEHFRTIEFDNPEHINQEKSKLFSTDLPTQFLWQNKVEQDIQTLKNKNLPFFGVVVSETGSGKTIIAPKIIKNLKKKNRFTLALGFRSLVLQTGKSYAENLGLKNKANLSTTIIGNNITQKIFDHDNYSNSQTAGSESLDITNTDFSLAEETEQHISYGLWHEKIFKGIDDSSLYSEKIKHVIDFPIVVCTIDYLIRIVEQLNAHDVFSFLRNYSSDLILDEIDNYSSNDLISLTKLCFLQGLAGKNLILMSATITQFMFNEFFSAYRDGLLLFQKIHKKPSSFNVGMFSNLQTNNFCQELNNNPAIQTQVENYYSQFISDFVKIQKVVSVKKHYFDIAKITNDWQQEIVNYSYGLHKNNGFCINDIQVSIGFVRFNNTHSAVKLAQFLWEGKAALPPDTIYLTQCYHSRMPLLVLNYIEKNLNQQLNRKTDNLKNYIETTIVPRLASNIKHIVLLVSTTTIQETGRDHDYDWAILEPASNRSLVQAAGRVKRHRSQTTHNPNVGVLSCPIKSFENNKKSFIWSRPGLGDDGFILQTASKTILSNEFQELQAQSKLHYKFNALNTDIVANLKHNISNSYGGYIYSGLCLLQPTQDAILANYEYLSHFKSLSYLTSSKSKYANYKYFEKYHDLKLTHTHAVNTSFRRSDSFELPVIVHDFQVDDNYKIFNQYINLKFNSIKKEGARNDYKNSLHKNLKTDNNGNKNLFFYQADKMIYPINQTVLLEELNSMIKTLNIPQENLKSPDVFDLLFECNLIKSSIEKTSFTYATGFFQT